MKILVTGGAGFIGSNFVLHMLKAHPSYAVINLDKLTYAGNLENLTEAEGNSRYTFVKGDIGDGPLVEDILKEGVDAVVNFAAESHVDRSILEPAPFIRTNILGTQVLLEAARTHSIKKFLQVGTDEGYGSLGPTGLFTEESPLRPNNPYSASKASADLIVMAYHHTYGFPALITRCSNNYGPYQFPEKFIPLTITNALEGKPVPVYGDGLHVRDWIHVLDHCQAVDQVLHRGNVGRIYNVGGVKDIPNIEIGRKILSVMGKPKSLLTFVKDRPGHDRRYAIDSGRMERDLGWTPRIPLDRGLSETIRWYTEHTEWWKRIKSGEYQGYYERLYGRT